MTKESMDQAARHFAEEAKSEYGLKLKSVVLFEKCFGA